MRGLLLKDFLLLEKTIKLYGIILAVYAVFSITSGQVSLFGSMVIIFSSMLPITALAYDERAKWEKYALTMPVTREDIVISKYILGLVLSLLGLVCASLVSLFSSTTELLENVYICFAFAGFGLLYQAIILPLMFKFGTEKGRIYMIIVFLVPFALIMGVSQFVNVSDVNSSAIETAIKVFPLFAIVLWIASIKLSLVIYEKAKQ